MLGMMLGASTWAAEAVPAPTKPAAPVTTIPTAAKPVAAKPVAAKPVAAKPAEVVTLKDAAPSAWSISTAGIILPNSLDLPTASGERLAQANAVDISGQISGGALLVDGDILVGNAISMQAGTASIATGAFGILQIPPEQLAAVLVTAVQAAAPVTAPAGFTGAILVNGERIVGQPSFLNPTQAGIDNGKRVVQIPRERVAALVIRATSAMSKPVVRLRLLTGDRVSGTLTAGTDGTWSLRHALGTWSIPCVQVGTWWTESAERLLLSSLVPTATYQDDLDPPLVPLRLDQDTEGQWLRLGESRIDRGMMLRAGTSATWTMTGAWKSLVAVVGIAHGGPAVIRLTGDNQTLWDSGAINAGAAARPCLVSVVGVKSLSLSVIPQADATIPAYAVVGWPFLLK